MNYIILLSLSFFVSCASLFDSNKYIVVLKNHKISYENISEKNLVTCMAEKYVRLSVIHNEKRFNSESSCLESNELTEMKQHFQSLVKNKKIGDFVIVDIDKFEPRCAYDHESKNKNSPRFIKEYECKNSIEMKNSISMAEKLRINKITNFCKKTNCSSFKQDAIKKQVSLGMPETLVYLSFGEPKDSNNSVGSYGVHKQLIFNGIYVYVENGKVTGWQN